MDLTGSKRLTNRFINDQSGMALVVAAVGVLFILATISYSLYSIVSADTEGNADFVQSAQAFFVARAGMEYTSAIFGRNFGYGGTKGTPISFGFGSFEVDTFKTDESGGTLASYERRVVITGTVGNSVRKIQLTYYAKDAFAYALFVENAGHGGSDLQIPIDPDKSISIEGDVMVKNGNVSINTGSSFTNTTIYHESGYSVTPSSGTGYTSEVDASPPSFPTYDTSWHDAQLAIADAVSSTTGNKLYIPSGNYTFSSTIDLSIYADTTLYIRMDAGAGVKQKIFIKADIVAGTTQNPAVIVVSAEVNDEININQSIAGDNVIIVSRTKIKIEEKPGPVRFGDDHSALAPEDRPERVNEIFTYGDIDAKSGEIWANLSVLTGGTKILKLKTTTYGACYTTGLAEIKMDPGHTFEGSVAADSIKDNEIDKGTLIQSGYNPSSFSGGPPSTPSPPILPGTWKEI